MIEIYPYLTSCKTFEELTSRYISALRGAGPENFNVAIVLEEYLHKESKTFVNFVSMLEKSIFESGLESKIESLDNGTDTLISKEFDPEGIEFSGGECQKLAIARAIYKDAPLIILDEPTSALDPIAEYDVYKRFSELAEGKCAVYISHRLSSTRFTDKIALFDDGIIKEYGSHSELISIENGIYRNMFETQAQYYVRNN